MKLQKSRHCRRQGKFMQLPGESPVAASSAAGSGLFSLCACQPGGTALPPTYPLLRLSLVPFQAGRDLALGPTAARQTHPQPSPRARPARGRRPTSQPPTRPRSRAGQRSVVLKSKALLPRRGFSKLSALYLPALNLCFLCQATSMPEIN